MMNSDNERRGNRHQRQQGAQSVAEEHASAKRDFELIPQAGRVEEEGPIVGRRADVEVVSLVEGMTIRREHQLLIVAGAGRPDPVLGIRQRRRDRPAPVRRIQHSEIERLSQLPQRGCLGGGERRAS